MNEHRYPRRFKHESKDASFAYVEQLDPSERIYAYNKDGSPCCYVDEGKTIHSSFDADNGDFFAKRGVWIETFDHHKDESGMYRHFSAAGPSPENSEVANLRTEVERLTKERDEAKRELADQIIHDKACAFERASMLRKERDELREQLSESEAAAAKMREAIDNWMTPEVICLIPSAVAICDLAHSTTVGREFLAEREKMREEIDSLKSKLRKIKTELSFGC